MSHLYNFGLSQEDERSESAALDLGPNDRVLSVASAGDMPLSLLALGARSVDAVDIDEAQLDLTRLKLAAVRSLPREDAIAFLGFMPAQAAQRLAWLQRLLPALPHRSRRFWLANKAAVEVGAIWLGRYEQYVQRLVRLLMPLIGRSRFDQLFACTTVAEQAEVFSRSFDRRRFHLLFRVAFHPRVFTSRGMDPRSLQHRDANVSLGDQYFAQFRALCTATPAQDNHLLQLSLLGRVLSTETVPAYLSERGAEIVRTRSEDLHLHHRDLLEHLRDLPPNAFDKAHMSNLPDWLPQRSFDEVMSLLADRAATGARLVWRFIHINRSVDASLADAIRIDHALGDRLRRTDRFPFYGIVCARVDGPTSAAKAAAPTAAVEVAEANQSASSDELPDGIELRSVDRDAGPDLLAINRACPIEADFTVCFERAPDFFKWPDIIYDRYQYTGIYEGERLIGYGMAGQLPGWTGAHYGPTFYGGDARILAGYRGKRLAEIALRHTLDTLPDEVSIGFGLVKEGNGPAQQTVEKGYSAKFEEAHRIRLEVANVFLLYGWPRPAVNVRRADIEDLDEMATLFNRVHRGRLFAPHLDAAALEQAFTLPGLARDQWWVARRNGRIVGMVGAWDQSSFHRTTVLRLSPWGQVLRGSYGAASRLLTRAAPLPGVDEPFRSLTLTRLAVEDNDLSVFRALLASVVNANVGRGYHMIHVGFVGDDPLRQATAFVPCQRFRSTVFVAARRDVERDASWFRAPVYVDLSMI